MDRAAASTAKAQAAQTGESLSPLVLRILDLVLVLVLLIATAPILVVVFILIRLDSTGPAIFRQRRLGLRKREFTVYKFRTMRAEADPARHQEYVRELVYGDESRQTDGRRHLYKLVVDDRITRVGRLLRRSSIDELPQLLNVVLGQMSIVGPRPVLPYEADLYASEYDRRFDVRPGLTGLWQVSGRNQRTYREMLTLDLEWAERRSVALYLWIVARTPLTLIRSRSAG